MDRRIFLAFGSAAVASVWAPRAALAAVPVRFDGDWRPLTFPRLTPTRYGMGGAALTIEANASSSLIYLPAPEAARDARNAYWFWAVGSSVPPTDLSRKGGDDRNISVYARSMPWLADVARIERAWLDAYHAADAEPLAPGLLASIPPERLAETAMTPHPTTRIVRSSYPAVSIFAANRANGPVGRITAADAEDALITRPALEVIVRTIPSGGAFFLTHLTMGEPLGAAAAAALAASPAFDLAANIAGMLHAGAFTAINQASQ